MTDDVDINPRNAFVLVGCGASKVDERVEVRDLYTSSYFSLKRELAEAVTRTTWRVDQYASTWSVLSAKHGVIPPRIEVDPYDVSVDDMSEDDLDMWASDVRAGLHSWISAPFRADNVDTNESPCRELIVLAGDAYVEPLRERDVFDEGAYRCAAVNTLCDVRFPFQAHDFGGIGEQMKWLRERIDEVEERGKVRESELSAYDAGYERERTVEQIRDGGIPDETTQTTLDEVEADPSVRPKKQTTLDVGGET